jgi:hypothetical protein
MQSFAKLNVPFLILTTRVSSYGAYITSLAQKHTAMIRRCIWGGFRSRFSNYIQRGGASTTVVLKS